MRLALVFWGVLLVIVARYGKKNLRGMTKKNSHRCYSLGWREAKLRRVQSQKHHSWDWPTGLVFYGTCGQVQSLVATPRAYHWPHWCTRGPQHPSSRPGRSSSWPLTPPQPSSAPCWWSPGPWSSWRTPWTWACAPWWQRWQRFKKLNCNTTTII